MATTLVIATTAMLRAVIAINSNSMAKVTPPSGALKVAAMPAPEPAAMRVMRSVAGIRMNWPRAEPNAEPICTIGPSRPTEPPLPIEMAEARYLTMATRGRMRPAL